MAKIDQLPKFDDARNYVLSGKTLNALIAAIKEQQILSITGADIERTPGGIHIKIP